GAQAWNRWANDTFGFALDRFLLTGAIGPCHRMDTAVAEVHRIADWGFTGIYGPGYMRHREMPQPHDRYWDPFWRACEERGIAIVVHAGFGTDQGMVFPQYEKIIDDVASEARSTDRDALMAAAPVAVAQESKDFFNNWVNHNVDSRRPMWQMMLGGVFD